MRIIIVAAVAAGCALSALAADTLSQHDREFALSALQASRKQFLDATSGLSAAQWNFKPAPDRWSIAEIAEHLALAEARAGGYVKQMMAAPAKPDVAAGLAGKENNALAALADRSHKVTAPEAIQPKRTWPNPDDAVAAYRSSRDALIDWIDTTQENVRQHVGDHPFFGPLDAYQWALVIAGHSDRHVAQMKEVKASEGYPK
jgi:hypothetical protein